MRPYRPAPRRRSGLQPTALRQQLERFASEAMQWRGLRRALGVKAWRGAGLGNGSPRGPVGALEVTLALHEIVLP